jgi:hypothetical protein
MSPRPQGEGAQPLVFRYGPRKLDAAQVGEIKVALEDGAGIVELAGRYGVSTATIRSIRAGETWAHVKP